MIGGSVVCEVTEFRYIRLARFNSEGFFDHRSINKIGHSWMQTNPLGESESYPDGSSLRHHSLGHRPGHASLPIGEVNDCRSRGSFLLRLLFLRVDFHPCLISTIGHFRGWPYRHSDTFQFAKDLWSHRYGLR